MAEAILFVLVATAFGLISRRIESTVISGPMVFVVAGALLGLFFSQTNQLDSVILLTLAEVALVLTLFTDASRMNLASLKGSADLPARMLGIGLPLTVIAGAAIALPLFTGLSFWEAAILGAILAPTDAGLGEAVVNSPKVPVRVRQTLNIEAGLNDGLTVPLLLIFIVLAEAEEGFEPIADGLVLVLQEIGIGVLMGIVAGLIGIKAIQAALAKKWMNDTFKRLAFPALAILIWAVTDALGGSGFIAAFVAGLSAAWVFGHIDTKLIGLIESEGRILDYLVFFIFGAIAVALLGEVTLAIILYAILSLTLIRMVPVAISLIGKHLSVWTIAFLGWFGPRGLASIVLMLVVIEEASQLPGLDLILPIASMTILLSVFAHGLTTNPLINRYGNHCEDMEPEAHEKKETTSLRTRKGSSSKDDPSSSDT